MLRGEATNTNYIVFDLTRSTIYCTWGEHTNQYTTDAVWTDTKFIITVTVDVNKMATIVILIKQYIKYLSGLIQSRWGEEVHFWKAQTNLSVCTTVIVHNKTIPKYAITLIFYGYGYCVWRHFQQFFRYIMSVSFIGGGNQSTGRKLPTCRKSLTNFIT